MNDPSVTLAPSRTVAVVRAIVSIGRENELSFLAGSIAFFACLSAVPTLLLVVAVGAAIGGDAFAMRVVTLFEAYLSAEGRTVVREALADSPGVVGGSVVGLLTLCWSALRVFLAIDIAFDRLYATPESPSLLRQLRDGAIAVMSIGTGILLLVIVQAIILRSVPRPLFSPRLVGVSVLLVGLLVILTPLYYVMPPASVSVREIIPGTAAAVVGLTVLQQGFSLYTAVAGQYQAYGFLGAVLLALLWLYFGALSLLFGAVVNVAISDTGQS